MGFAGDTILWNIEKIICILKLVKYIKTTYVKKLINIVLLNAILIKIILKYKYLIFSKKSLWFLEWTDIMCVYSFSHCHHHHRQLSSNKIETKLLDALEETIEVSHLPSRKPLV